MVLLNLQYHVVKAACMFIICHRYVVVVKFLMLYQDYSPGSWFVRFFVPALGHKTPSKGVLEKLRKCKPM